jgi:hypothetical protein
VGQEDSGHGSPAQLAADFELTLGSSSQALNYLRPG